MKSLPSKDLLKHYKALSESERMEVTRCLIALRRPALKDQPYRATGRLVFDEPGNPNSRKPLHNMIVELWDRDLTSPSDFLGRDETDHDGYFEIPYDPSDAGRFDRADLELRIYDTQHVYEDANTLTHTKSLVHSIPGDDDVTDAIYNFGECAVPYWPYDPHTLTPRLWVIDDGSPPQQFSIARSLVLLKEVAPLELIKRKHFMQYALAPNSLSLEDVQSDYPENLTLRLERENPGCTRCDEYFAERMLNGMAASVFDRDPENEGWYWIHHHWNSYEQNGKYVLPNVDMRFEIRDGKFYPTQIGLQFRKPEHLEASPPLLPPLIFTPKDGDRWEQAKRHARVSSAITGELDMHLATTHLNLEQYAIAAYRNLRKSPVRYLLFPHLKEVVLINRDANRYLLGEDGYIARATALTNASINKRIQQTLGTLDWKNWKPREALTSNHTYAHTAQLFWKILTKFVDRFFQKNRRAIAAHWYEIHRFSEDLVNHSAPFFLCDYLRKHLEVSQRLRGNGGSKKGSAAQKWFETNERMDLSIPRYRVNGEEKAIQPITLSGVMDEVSLANLKQVCRYVIFHATFGHTWSNERQNDDFGEILYSCGGLRPGDKNGMAPESDTSIAPDSRIASETIWYSLMLSRAAYGFITRNEERDINPELVEAFRAKAAEFQKLGIDVRKIQSRTNI